MLLTSRKSVWYTCCNQVRGDLIFQTKQKYFSEYNACVGVIDDTTDSDRPSQRLISRETTEIWKDYEREDAERT